MKSRDTSHVVLPAPKPFRVMEKVARIDTVQEVTSKVELESISINDSNLVATSETVALPIPSEKKEVNFFIMDYFVYVLLIFLLAERFLFYRVKTDITKMRADFVKLSVLLQSFLINVNFKKEGNSWLPESKLDSTDTQILISPKELKKLREQANVGYFDKLFKKKSKDKGEEEESEE